MTQANSALSHANGVLRAHHLPFRLRVGHNSRWVSVYENLPGRRVRERAVRGCSCQDDLAIEALCFQLVSEARSSPTPTWSSCSAPRRVRQKRPQPTWPLAGPRSARPWWPSSAARA